MFTMTQVKFECRISEFLKDKIHYKSSQIGISSSEFIRIILNDSINIDELFNSNMSINEGRFDEFISCRISYEKHNKLKEISKNKNITFSSLIRLILHSEKYIVGKSDYINLCEFELIRSGKLLNTIAHELNINNLLSKNNEEVYQLILAKLVEPGIVINNILMLLENPPVMNNRDHDYIIYPKTIQLKWSSHIYRISNNIRQIFSRLYADQNLINENLYRLILNELNNFSECYKRVFIYLKIFNKVITQK
jgi:antitoxin component of RelBE/YafQ-DinJ toxin-antitoxin module